MSIKQYTLESLQDSKFQFTINDNLLELRIHEEDIGLVYDLYINKVLEIPSGSFYNEIVFYKTKEFQLYFKNINKVDNHSIISYYDLYNYNLFVEVFNE